LRRGIDPQCLASLRCGKRKFAFLVSTMLAGSAQVRRALDEGQMAE
jgi:hypothetical protein